MRVSPAALVTIPSRLAQTSRVSSDWNEGLARGRALYRLWYRSAPEICTIYALNLPPSVLRAKFRTAFEANRGIKELAVYDILLHKGYVEYQETVNMWKQRPHIMRWFNEEETDRTLRHALQCPAMPCDSTDTCTAFNPPLRLCLPCLFFSSAVTLQPRPRPSSKSSIPPETRAVAPVAVGCKGPSLCRMRTLDPLQWLYRLGLLQRIK